jgi:large subunit ribosomal protein L15
MELHQLKPAEGAVKRQKKRLGRGEGSGKGGTSTKGHKGGQSRSGYSKKLGFEGGQMPLQRRVPKFGFKNINRKEFKVINLDVLQQLSEDFKVDTIDKEFLREHGLINKKDLLKILGRGEINSKINVKADAFSSTAKTAIEAKGGTAEQI